MVTGLRDVWRHQVSLWGALAAWTSDGGGNVGDEAEAFLEGRLLQQMQRCGWHGWVPPWLWLNAVAHGDRPTVIVVSGLHPRAGSPLDESRDGQRWRWAQARIAGELLRCSCGSDELLRALQDAVLVPLSISIGTDVTPDRLVEIAVEGLRGATV
jgi:hypothetical protein